MTALKTKEMCLFSMVNTGVFAILIDSQIYHYRFTIQEYKYDTIS